MLDTVHTWHVAFTGPNAEEKADQSLRQANYATFLPFELINRKRAIRGRPGQYKVGWEKQPLYKRYIFLGAREGQGLYDANNAIGISTVLYCGDHPVIVPHKVIDALMMRADANGVMDHTNLIMSRELFKEGQRVVIDGLNPFSGIEFKVTSDTGKVVRAVADILGQLTPIELSPDQLRAI